MPPPSPQDGGPGGEAVAVATAAGVGGTHRRWEPVPRPVRGARCPARRLRSAARWGCRPHPRGGRPRRCQPPPPAAPHPRLPGGFPPRRRYVRAGAGARREAGAARPRDPPSFPPLLPSLARSPAGAAAGPAAGRLRLCRRERPPPPRRGGVWGAPEPGLAGRPLGSPGAGRRGGSRPPGSPRAGRSTLAGAGRRRLRGSVRSPPPRERTPPRQRGCACGDQCTASVKSRRPPQSFSTCEHCCYRRCSAKLLTFQSLFLARRLNIISYIST